MRKRIFSGIMLTLLLICMSIFAFNIQPAKTSYSSDSVPPVSKSKEKHFTISFPKPQVAEIRSYDWFKMENCSYLTNPGKPMLPVRNLVVKLPEGSIVTKVRVKVKEVLLQGSFSILPVPWPSIVGSQTIEKISEDPTIYKAENLFLKNGTFFMKRMV